MDQKHFYGGFWHRVAASLIDSSFMPLFVGIIRLSMGKSFLSTESGPIDSDEIFVVIFSFILSFLYYTFFQWKFSGTIGKKVLGLTVVNAKDYSHVSIGQMVGRYFVFLFSLLLMCLGVLWVALDKKKQGWHDKAAGTVVVKQKYLKDLMLQNGVFPDQRPVQTV